MANLTKRPIVIQDLIAHATYISLDNLDAGDRFLYAAEATFQRIAELPAIGKLSGFMTPTLTQVRQYPVKGFSKHIIFIKFSLTRWKLFGFSTVPKIWNLFLNRSHPHDRSLKIQFP